PNIPGIVRAMPAVTHFGAHGRAPSLRSPARGPGSGGRPRSRLLRMQAIGPTAGPKSAWTSSLPLGHAPPQVVQQVDAGDEPEEFFAVHHDRDAAAFEDRQQVLDWRVDGERLQFADHRG